MRYFLFSAVIHGLIVLAGLSLFKSNIRFDMAGDPTVTFSMVGESSETGGLAADIVAGRPKPAPPKPAKKKPQPLEEKVETPPVEKTKPLQEKSKEAAVEPLPQEAPAEPEEIPETMEEKDPLEELREEISREEVPHDSSDEGEDKPSEAAADPTQTSQGDELLGEGLVQLDDGSVAAKNQGIKGLSYGFISQPEPDYPDIARRMGVRDEVVIKARFLIGYDGSVEEVRFYDDMKNFGFREEVEKALRGWKATPIEVNGKQVKLYFYKSFKFERLN